MRLSPEYHSYTTPNILKVASKDKSRPILTAVYLDVDSATLQATDSYCLASLPVEIGEGDVSGLIPAEALTAYLKAAKAWRGGSEYGPALDCSQSSLVSLATPDGSSDWHRPEGQWPNFPRLIPTELSGFTVKFSASKLAQVAAALGTDAVTLSFVKPADVVEGDGTGYFLSALKPIVVHNGGHGEVGLVMPIRQG